MPRKANTVAARKEKGRRLQRWIRDTIIKYHPHLTTNDVRSTSMGCGGVDVQLSEAALGSLPYKIEAKNVEKVSLWASYEQACNHAGDEEPLLFIMKNYKKPIAVVDAEYFFKLNLLANVGKETARAFNIPLFEEISDG